jgi:hypothetical protein
MAKGAGAWKEQVGASRACDGCGKIGRERIDPRQPMPKKRCCSAACGEKVMKEPEWGSIGWLKV